MKIGDSLLILDDGIGLECRIGTTWKMIWNRPSVEFDRARNAYCYTFKLRSGDPETAVLTIPAELFTPEMPSAEQFIGPDFSEILRAR